MTLWKFYCMEDTYPGMWPRWFLHRCVGVGWWTGWGFSLIGETDSPRWTRARNALTRIKVGDHISGFSKKSPCRAHGRGDRQGDRRQRLGPFGTKKREHA